MVSRTIKAALGLLALLLTAYLVPPVQAKPTPAKPALNLIKINQFYVLYTCPITPRLDKSGTFIVGAEAIALMLNARFTQNPQATTITMTKNGHAIQFTAGSGTALVDGKPVALPVAAQLDPPTRQMLVPLSPLVITFRIRMAWNQTRHTLTLTGKTLMNNIAHDTLSQIYQEDPGPDTGRLVPIAATPISAYRRPPRGYNLDLTVQNVSRRTLPKDRSFINTVGASRNFNSQSSVINYGVGGAPFPPDMAVPDPPWKPGATRRLTVTVFMPPDTGYMLYVAVWPVVSRRR